MINKEMNDKSEKIDQEEPQKPADELGGFCFSTAIKIFDPNTEEVLVQQRGDN